MRRNILRIFIFVLMFTIFVLPYTKIDASALKDGQVPQSLSEWKSWALYDMEDKLCPTEYNNENAYMCRWPSRLKLSINATGGSFEQEWTIFSETWAPLPGSLVLWPENVKNGTTTIPVINNSNAPSVYLQSGKHLIKGTFSWKEIPEMILVPSETGIVTLAINGISIDYPVIDKTGRLWLQKRVTSKDQENTQSVSVFRLIQDSIPMEVTSLFQINISGQAREIRFENVLLKNSIPMRMKSPLPARIGDNGELMIHARPGRWEIYITTRFIDSIDQLGPITCSHGEEIWSFAPQNHLRMVKIEGVPSIEPGRTNMPDDWKQYAAYFIEPETSMTFKMLRRGDPDPAPDKLNLKKSLWLDFDGHGFTIHDNISGKISRTWRLTMNPPTKLGRVGVDGQGQLITADENTGNPGVELRRGQLNMSADSRFTDAISLIPAVGWDQDFSSISGVLNLPPGWRLFASKGVDKMPGTWILKWTLLDFFLVLIISAAVVKLRGWKWGLFVLITMVLIYHENNAPRLIWLHILAAIALIPILPTGKFKQLVYIWGGTAGIILIIMSIPFMVEQIRIGLFPQLEHTGRYYEQTLTEQAGGAFDFSDDETVKSEAESRVPEEAMQMEKAPMQRQRLRSRIDAIKTTNKDYYRQKRSYYVQDPNALIQTGPGLPSWKWTSIPMTWNGPVNKDQQIRLWLISPPVNMILSFVRVILLAFMIIGILDLRAIWQKMKTNLNTIAISASLFVVFTGIAHAQTDAALFPPQELLKQYQDRLLEKADCFPQCADSPRMTMTIQPKHLRILLEIHAATRTAVALPGNLKSWTPDQVLLGSTPVKELARTKDGILWALVPKGIHQIVMTGKTGPGNAIQIPMPLTPHFAKYTSNGWDVQGIHKDGIVESGIQLTRLKKEVKDTSLSTSVSLPPFLHIERIISLGITWEMTTTVTRITPVGTPVIITIPLIEGESVTKSGIRVENGKAQVTMGPNETRIWWDSSLTHTDIISLKAPESVPWTETWILDASPIWHCEPSGIPIVHHQDAQGHWRPTWQPWPGESISINVKRPQAIPGQMVTIDSALLSMTPGLRSHESQLTIRIRASKGGQHQILLPDGADLQLVKINDKSQPIRQEGKKVTIPLQPGSQTIHLEWNTQSASSLFIKGPAVQIGNQAVNARVSFKMPYNRWVVWAFGPTLGPAVLYWSYIIVILLVAILLGQITITPLKARHWLILSLGLTQVPIQMALIVAGWFLILGLRKKYQPINNALYFDLIQVVIVLWTIASFVCLYAAISQGLLGIPDMQISGNGSTATQLNWTQDRISGMMPQPSVISLPKYVYNIVILFWALWLVIYLIKWLRWGWQCFIEGGIWKKIQRKPKMPPPINRPHNTP